MHAIPLGRVASYGQIAGLLRPPAGVDPKAYLAFGPRWVGGAMAACPEDVPWQRVVNARGQISPRPGAEDQKALLEQEGIQFDDHLRIDLSQYRWKPDEEWCREHGLVWHPPEQQVYLPF